jgi:hypothetical protein
LILYTIFSIVNNLFVNDPGKKIRFIFLPIKEGLPASSIFSLFFFYAMEEITLNAIFRLIVVAPLYLISTHGACDHPAGPAAVHASMDSVQSLTDDGWTYPELIRGEPADIFPASL